MNRKMYKRIAFVIFLVATFTLSACGTLRVETEPTVAMVEPAATLTEMPLPTPAQVTEEADATVTSEEAAISPVEFEPMVEPLATVGYSNEENGISFSYPTSWAMEEEAHAFVFRKGTVQLRVGYRMPGDTTDHGGRTGMGGTGVSVLEGTAQFLGQELARYGVHYDDLLSVVVYGGEPGTKVQSGEMEITIVLDDPDTDYQTLTLTEEILAETEIILASFAVGSTQGSPVAGLNTYINSEYGFTLHTPSTWSVEEVNDEDFVGSGSRSVQLSQGTVKLIIGYRRTGEDTAIGGSGAPGGEFEIRGTTHILGKDVERYVIVFEGKDKVVIYDQPGPPPLSAGGLEFALRMDDFAQVNYEEIELSQTVQDEADMILSSLAIIEVEGGSETENVDYDYTGWQSYTNEKLGYSLMHPSNADIMGANRDEAVEFVGPIVDTDHWPWLWVQHFDSEFYRPPAGTDVRQWIADSNILYKSLAQNMTVGGLPAVHFHLEQSQQAYAMDEYYVINGDQLYKITVLHSAGLQDWELYDQFLQSITFVPI